MCKQSLIWMAHALIPHLYTSDSLYLFYETHHSFRADNSRRFITPFEYLKRNNAVACFVRDFIRETLSRDEIWNLKTRIMLRYRKLYAQRDRTCPHSDRTIAVLRTRALQVGKSNLLPAEDVIYLQKQITCK